MTLTTDNTRQIQELGDRFLNATVNKWGTDEEVVYKVLDQVKKNGLKEEFSQYIASHLDKSDAKKFLKSGAITVANIVPAILRDEMDGVELEHAETVWVTGKESWNPTALDSFVEGLKRVVDYSSTSSKLGTVGVIAVGVGLAIFSPPLAAVFFSGVLITGAAISTIQSAHSVYQIATTKNQTTRAEAYADLGEAVGSLGVLVAFRKIEPEIVCGKIKLSKVPIIFPYVGRYAETIYYQLSRRSAQI